MYSLETLSHNLLYSMLVDLCAQKHNWRDVLPESAAFVPQEARGQ
jgi:hypothetical protein